MDFLEFKISNIQKELNDLNNYICCYREKVEKDLTQAKELSPNERSKNELESTEKKKNWACIVEGKDEESRLKKKLELLETEYKKLNENILFIKKYLHFNENSKILKFNFYHCTITWELKEEHFVGDQVKIILNPVPFNKDIYQIFYFNNKENKLGFKKDNEYKWFKISFKEKLIEYPDENNNNKYVYCSFIEKSLN